MSQTALLGGLASALCLSLMWPYCYQKQWGIGGFASCPCYHPICGRVGHLDCGWVGENDHEFFGSQEEQEIAAEEERRRRQAWADNIVAKREQDRLRNAMANQYKRLHNHVAAGRDGVLVHGRERVMGVVGGLRPHRSGPGVATVTVEEVDPARKKNIALGVGERNLDDIVGGSKLREPKRGSVLFDGPGGVDEPTASRYGSINQNKRRSIRSSQYSGIGGTTSSVDTRRDPPRIGATLVVPGDGTEDTQLNRGVITPQTVILGTRPNAPQRPIQEQYTGTKPMVLSPTTDNSLHIPEGTSPRDR
ncbi:SubName: Full=Uncharacterized protein {ECO:0000313/EMBL:CCA68074.1} [Serendipita indica DSM 11827]|nr:SubName: Full=Uncharacterized protein {ECO:0000313/EMBL:CCA68074.1} [Serendipita indica DSM 11827]